MCERHGVWLLGVGGCGSSIFEGLVAASSAPCTTQGSRNIMFVPRRMGRPCMVYVQYLLVWRLQIRVDSSTALSGTTGTTITTGTRAQACCRESLTNAAMATVLRSRSKRAQTEVIGACNSTAVVTYDLEKQCLY